MTYDVTEAGGGSEVGAGEAEVATVVAAVAALGTKTGALRALDVRVDVRVSGGDSGLYICEKRLCDQRSNIRGRRGFVGGFLVMV
jgi:hypothetical protein